MFLVLKFDLKLKMIPHRNLIIVWSLHFQNHYFLSLFLDGIKNNKWCHVLFNFFYKIKN